MNISKGQMAQHIPMISGEDGARLAKTVFHDSEVFRVPLEHADRFIPLLSPSSKIWIDPCVDGLDDIETRRPTSVKGNPWFDFMSGFAHFEKMGRPDFHSKPAATEVFSFVKSVLNKCVAHKPTWITVPQIPILSGTERNKINRTLAAATAKWKTESGFSGRLILPLVMTHVDQVTGKTARNPIIQQAKRCYQDAGANGLWIVNKGLADDIASSKSRERFQGIINLHAEINEEIPSRIRIAGPYWGLNLVLWARGLIEYLAIGIGSGYQHFLSGGHARTPSVRLAIPFLRRRVGTAKLATWLDKAITRLPPPQPALHELVALKGHLSVLTQPDRAREQIAKFYKSWYDAIAAKNKPDRAAELFKDLTLAYALGRRLPDIEDGKTARRPEAIAEPLMLNCL